MSDDGPAETSVILRVGKLESGLEVLKEVTDIRLLHIERMMNRGTLIASGVLVSVIANIVLTLMNAT